jgi:hypothetical protein
MSQYMDSFRFERDECFSSNKDFHVAKFMANDMIQIYIKWNKAHVINYLQLRMENIKFFFRLKILLKKFGFEKKSLSLHSDV